METTAISVADTRTSPTEPEKKDMDTFVGTDFASLIMKETAAEQVYDVTLPAGLVEDSDDESTQTLTKNRAGLSVSSAPTNMNLHLAHKT